ncbi:sensor histidine kinase [Pseudodesulfovibrio sediminis]|uniref:histidine kinase n=1 Tax=Pseudodesulfovibrio sediminis TaxID=2810563 RepID=A0ABN6ET54_9BACT|nr:ATP-binding protein [Pseudodesulfovibrio sediminis]BCS88063.1 hypothetical protein PSDVSF_13050 [Pseudodesulfovibrio sediminis]
MEKNVGIPIRLLIIEDSEDDALLTLRQLRKGGYDPVYRIVETPAALENALLEETWDIVLSDFHMPSFDGREALRIVRERGLDVPFVIISGVLVEEDAVEILKSGASDYVRKGNWSRLIPAIGRELREARGRREQQRAEEQEAEAQERYRNLFESAVEGIFQSTPAGRFVTANPAMAVLAGYDSPQELINSVRNISNELYVHSESRDMMLEILEAHGMVSGFEVEVYRKDGSRTWIVINSRGLFDDSGKLELIEGFVVDISKRKRAEAELANMNQQLEQLVADRTSELEQKALELEQANRRLQEVDQNKTAFLSSVSHELRTPLTSVLGFAKLIHRDFCKVFLPTSGVDEKMNRMGDRICDNLDIIVNEGERLTRLVNDFLDLVRIEAGRMNWDDQRVSPTRILKGAADAVNGLFVETPGLDLVFDVPEDLPDMTIDPDRMTQVIINLLNNAVKFTHKGHVALRAAPDTESDAIQIQIEDTGVGIPVDDIAKVFSKFHQVKGQEGKDIGTHGSGLGLSISQQIVEHYGGTIRVQSEVGQGSTFFLTLPLNRE